MPPEETKEVTTTPAAETPSTTETNQPAETNEDLGSDVFGEFANEDLGNEVEQITTGTGEEQPPAVTKPAETPEKVKTPAQQAAEAVKALGKPGEVTPPETTPSTPQTTPPQQPVTQPKAETPQAKSLEELKKERETARAKVFDELTKSYSLSEEDANAVITDPETVLPKLLARVHMDAVDRMALYMQNALPHMLTAHVQQQTVAKQATEQFFGEWPELNKPEYAPTVARVLSGYRQANPEATAEDVIREGGVAAIVALRLPMPDRVMQQHNVTQPDATQSVSPSPAPASSAPAPAASRKPSNIFEVIAEEDISEGV